METAPIINTTFHPRIFTSLKVRHLCSEHLHNYRGNTCVEVCQWEGRQVRSSRNAGVTSTWVSGSEEDESESAHHGPSPKSTCSDISDTSAASIFPWSADVPEEIGFSSYSTLSSHLGDLCNRIDTMSDLPCSIYRRIQSVCYTPQVLI